MVIAKMNSALATVEKKRWSSAYSDLEPEICDLVRLSRIASDAVLSRLGEVDVVNGNCIIPEQDVDESMFIVTQLKKATENLETLFYAKWNEVVGDELS